MNRLPSKSLILIVNISLINIFISGCESDNNSADLAKAVELEYLRANGTIIEEVEISNAQTRLRAGETHQLIATGLDSKGDSRDVTAELEAWASSDESIATVNNSGLVTGIATSTVNQGKVTITATTINGIEGTADISISDVKASAISLKQKSPATGNIQTCLEASIDGDVTYEDGYVSLNTIKDMSFTLNEQTSAVINNDGILYTSSETLENITVTATINNIDAQLLVQADPANLASIDILVANENTTSFSLNIGQRVKVSADAKLFNTPAGESFNIDPSIQWQQRDSGYTGVTSEGTNKGTILGLKQGFTELIASCGGKQAIAVIEINGDANLENIQINNGEESIVITPESSTSLTLTANYDDTPNSLNISEFASWQVSDNNIISLELISAGLSSAYYQVTSNSSSAGSANIIVSYDEQPPIVLEVIVEE
jgi:type IV pilus biogenesis protein CpaD/CtpE